jgi:alkylhydroperoxidase family enzyme
MATRYALGRREGITGELVTALGDYEHGPFSDREKAALRYADQLFADHHKVDDAFWNDLRARFTEDELLELTWVLAEFIALGKVIYVLGIQHGGHPHAVQTDVPSNVPPDVPPDVSNEERRS